jgi:hypothetical protein
MPSASARLGEAANDYLVHLRFGRTGVLPGFEKAESRAKLAKQHAVLGHDRQVTDADVVAVQAGDERGTVVAQLAWYAPGEQILRSSTVEQTWVKGPNGSWLVEDESVVSGDKALFEVARSEAGADADHPAKELGKGARFPTVRIGQ